LEDEMVYLYDELKKTQEALIKAKALNKKLKGRNKCMTEIFMGKNKIVGRDVPHTSHTSAILAKESRSLNLAATR
jgi:hypothetical protein